MAIFSWSLSAAAFSILCFFSLCYSEKAPNYSFMKHASDHTPKTSYHDYIIIGGGTAGIPLAATLSHLPNASVLLLERGGSPYGNPNITHLSTFAATLADASPSSPAQQFVSEDGVFNARARVLGGGTCLNAGFYTRAGAEYVKGAGWEEKAVEGAYRWVERTVSFEPPMREWQSAVRDGLLEVGVTPDNGFTYEHLYGTKVGGSIFDKEGRRHTAADLLQDARSEGITVLLQARVARILFRHRVKARPRAHGVIFRDSKGVVHKAYLKQGRRNEIIVSAGAMGSPQLLMLSGIGPKAHLESFGIKVLLDNPLVGQGMSDNPMNALFIPSPLPVETSLIQVVGITRYGTYIEAASGSLFTASQSYPTQITPQASSDISTQFSTRGGFIIEKIIGPLSTGHLELKNRNPDDNPKVTFNYFKEPKDLRRCVAGMKTIEKVVESKAFSKFRYPFISMEALLNMTSSFPMNLLPKHQNDSKSLEQFCRDTVMTIWHYHGGCQVGRVVDRDYRVIGVDALRVVDGSTFIYSPGTNPQATVMMLGRYMGVKIQSERLSLHKTENGG